MLLKYTYVIGVLLSVAPINRVGSLAQYVHSDSLNRKYSPINYDTSLLISNIRIANQICFKCMYIKYIDEKNSILISNNIA